LGLFFILNKKKWGGDGGRKRWGIKKIEKNKIGLIYNIVRTIFMPSYNFSHSLAHSTTLKILFLSINVNCRDYKVKSLYVNVCMYLYSRKYEFKY
jgi:hypothetical protein